MLPVLGVPVRLRTNAAELVEAFERTLGYWRTLEAHPDLLSGDRVEGRLELRRGEEGAERPVPVDYELPDDRQLLISTPASRVLSDPRARRFDGWVTPALLEDRGRFDTAVMESLALSVVTWLDRHPVHASAVVHGGAALLLCGPSGRGKSTLAYAAARVGFKVLADDVVFVQTRPFRVWGRPRSLHLPPDAARHFPELADLTPRRLAQGKVKIVVDPAGMGAAAPWPLAERAGVCVLEQGRGGPPRCEPLAPAELAAAMTGQLDPGFDRFQETLPDLARRLAAGGAWRLHLGEHPEKALPLLRSLVEEVRPAVVG